MKMKFIFSFLLVLLMVTAVHAKENKAKVKESAKALSGMSIVGNDEAPKALYLVPWKSSEIGEETSLNMPDKIGYIPVDREEFRRKLDYYYISTTRNTGR